MTTGKVGGQKEKMLVMGKLSLTFLSMTDRDQYPDPLSSETIYETLYVTTWMRE